MQGVLGALINKLNQVSLVMLALGFAFGILFGKHALSWVDTASFEKRVEVLAQELQSERVFRIAAGKIVERSQQDLTNEKKTSADLRGIISNMVPRDEYDKVASERDSLKKPLDARLQFWKRLQENPSYPCTSDFILYQGAMFSREQENGDIYVSSDRGYGFFVHKEPRVVAVNDMYAQVRIQKDKQTCSVIFSPPPM
jgi:hypothetical protein